MVGGGECGRQSLTVGGDEGSYQGDGNILKQIDCDAYTTCKFTKKYWIVYLQLVNYMIYKICLIELMYKNVFFCIKDVILKTFPILICDFSSIIGLTHFPKE